MDYNIRKNGKYVIVYFRDDNYILHDDDFLTQEEALSLAENYIQFGLEILESARNIKKD